MLVDLCAVIVQTFVQLSAENILNWSFFQLKVASNIYDSGVNVNYLKRSSMPIPPLWGFNSIVTKHIALLKGKVAVCKL